MAKFCGNCGTKLNDDAAFCTGCGTPCKVPVPAQQSVPQPVPDQAVSQTAVQQAATQTAPQSVIPESNNGGNFIPNTNPANVMPDNGMPAYNVQYGIGGGNTAGGTAVKKPVNKKLLMIGGIVLGLIIILIVVLSVALSGSYEDPLDNYVKVLQKGDGKAYKASTSNSIVGTTLFSSDLGDYSDLYYSEEAQELREEFIDDFGPDAKVSYKVISKKEISSSQINMLNALTNLLDENIKVSKGYTLTVAFTYSGSLKQKTDTVDIDVIKINGDWVFSDDDPDDIYPY